ncbi:DUF3888 domain-containing protein [Lutispora saccharofermentans]|uniref:DUF3888 domain-containing protein n=1 Tax=Lutispora saccharofermentans TaxID=3024236 RepID=A0ABT1NKP7_9FIRM|nr:DUF3888 domain-containing protein [Lutispora saccharofermentans]MCQ1530703.1 DUF3888 domain-containing protein [Lutispora saccharofermentans]
MKKVLVVNRKMVLLICFLLLFISIIAINFDLFLKYSIPTNSKKLLDTKIYFEPGIPPEGSIEEIYQDIFVTLILPCIEDAVENYYGQPFQVAPYDVKILSVERPSGYRTFLFRLTIKVSPYYGPHISVGVDRITISLSDKCIVEKFEHIKSYEFPYLHWHY